ncbi:hypothetical protein ABZ922_13885 [Streptomyces shenzhenensis]|uniref:hypothetical protein n=1 Tax=Streptomyces shenzhenensis TaxID=943815 RepID=UPI0033DF5B44
MTESWTLADGSAALTGDEAVELLRRRIAAGGLETWLTSRAGRSLAVVSNAERAMVLLLDAEGEPEGHAVDPVARGTSGGFVLANGQCDVYPDRDTVPLAEAFRTVRRLIATGEPPTGAGWAVDR